MKFPKICGLVLAAWICGAWAAEPLKLNARGEVESAPKSGVWRTEAKAMEWDPAKTALVICDMWNEHWCKGATERVGEMAPRMNEVVKAARARGVFIIHAPSDTMKFYEGAPQRQRAQNAPKATPPVPLKGWCHLDPAKEAPLPIDDSDGGCDEDPKCKEGGPWKRQIAAIEIAEQDAITDSAEAYNLMQERGIENVIVMGVHANMCVLGRPFSIRQMVGVGKNVVLMRDMTDTMYNSRRRPFVSHFRGTDLIVQHVERYWCPSITSADFLGGEPFRFAKDPENPANQPKKTSSAAPTDGKQEGPMTPEDSQKAFTVFEDLQIEQILAEPVVRQPLHLSWDERGRLWVVQYLQYPAPAGLTLVSKDQFWRAVYDKVPAPPPKHFKGEDKITIHEDTDGDGVLDRHKTFVEGLNIVTAVAQGSGGVWVLNPPYLLFFPDANRDDVVDADPVVHLAGFGLEDTHSVANSLRWGPDGWLYGAHGSTVTANITRPGLDKEPIARMMGQGIWRYHPETKRFEVFAEGGGNAFGLEMDDKARIFSGHNGGNTRGFHYVQGGYLQKGFEKHGPLSNPYAFGYFRQMAHNDVERFTHTFVIYGGGALPERYDGQILGIEPLQGRVVLSEVLREGSSFKTRDLGYAVTTTDKYFKPVDIKVGPDGAVYVADWYDRQVTHTRNYEGNIDKSNGRIYRLSRKGSARMAARDLSKVPAAEWPGLLRSPNRWVRETALRLIGERRDAATVSALKAVCEKSTGQIALEALWAVNLAGGFDEAAAMELLEHADPHVRLWAARLLGDARQVSPPALEKLEALAQREPHVEARSQLASTARRLPAAQGLPLVRHSLARAEDAQDIHIPLLLWWAVEAKVDSDRAAVLSLLEDAPLWNQPLTRTAILERLMKRLAMAGTQSDLRDCARLLRQARNPADAKILMAGFESAFQGRAMGALPRELEEAIAAAGGESLTLSIRRGDTAAAERALALLREASTPRARRSEIIAVFGQVAHPAALPMLLEIAEGGSANDAGLRRQALSALQIYADPSVAARVLPILEGGVKLPADLRLAAFNLLASRKAWAAALVEALKEKRLEAKQVPAEIADLLRSEHAGAAEVFGEREALDTAAVNGKMGHFAGVLRAGSGDPFAGYNHFNLACGACHRLFGEGGQIGPDLTAFNRADLDAMLMSIVNPSGEIREGYENIAVETRDGRNLSGFLAEKQPDAIVLRGLDGAATLLPNAEIASMQPAGRSLMPEGLLEAFEEQQVRDLFAYLRSTQPLVKQR